jgi:tetratricopeptide (TPR) repeat protein
MSSPGEGNEINLSDKFPDLRPIKSAPTLSTINGIGGTMYGRRDFDSETGTCIKTHCATVLFLPLACMGAYRVADAPGGGWFFLGKEPLSGVAKMWNVFVVAAIVAIAGGVAWNSYTGSPDYIAGQNLAKADAALADGQIAEAAEIYAEVSAGKAKHSVTAAEKLKSLVQNETKDAPLDQVVKVFALATTLQKRGEMQFDGLLDSGIALSKQHSQQDSKGALALLNTLGPIAGDDSGQLVYATLRLLEAVVVDEPGDVEVASQLAVIYERQERFEDCKKLLEPLRDRLATREGARVLGQVYARDGELDRARELLGPYTNGRLKLLHAAEKKLEAVYQRLRDGVFGDLQNGDAKDFNYAAYDRLDETAQIEMVEAYIDKKVQANAQLIQARETVIAEASVVPVALDLGIILLRSGQTMDDPAQRRAVLQQAEKTFLAIRGIAGQSDEYQLYLGQVYFWLEKQADGQKLLDQLLVDSKRAPKTLLSVASTLRDVGDESQARKLMEEAYEKSSDQDTKYQAAGLRALTAADQDDKIDWLRRADQKDMAMRAALELALGGKASDRGDEVAAKKHYRESIKLNDQLPEAASTLNNAALAYFGLWAVSGNRADYDQGVAMLEMALSLNPSGPVLLFNTTSAILEGAYLDLVGDQVDLQLLRKSAQTAVGFLYSDAEGHQKIVDALLKNQRYVKAMQLYDRLIVVAPQKTEVYSGLAAIYAFIEDAAAVEDLVARVERVELNTSGRIEETLAYLSGERDEAMIEQLEQFIKRAQTAIDATRGQDTRTFSMAISGFVEGKIALAYVGRESDPDALVQLAEQAHQAAPSAGSSSTLQSALAFRAKQTLAANEPEFAKLVNRARRSMHPGMALAIAMSNDGPLCSAALASPDVQRLVKLVAESCRRLPRFRTSYAWAILKASEPELAAEAGRFVTADQLTVAKSRIDFVLSPASLADAMDVYWAKLIAGDEETAKAALRQVKSHGAPLPFDVD